MPPTRKPASLWKPGQRENLDVHTLGPFELQIPNSENV